MANHRLEVVVTKVQTHGVISQPFNPLALAVVEGASFVARTFCGDSEHMGRTMLAALRHAEGFVLVDILQSCVSFNRVNTFKWYRQRVRPVGDEHDPADRTRALELALKWGDEIPIGVIYKSGRPSFESRLDVLKAGPLVERYAART